MNEIDFAWLINNGPHIYAEYAGKWIAVHDSNVVGVGTTATEAATQARDTVGSEEFILEAVDAEGDVIYADLQMA